MTRWPLIAGSILLTSVARAENPVGIPFAGGFADSSTLPLYLPEGKLTIATKYGKLTVPLSEIARIELGFRYPEGMEPKITAAASGLGSSDFRVREQAEKDLLAWRELSIPALRKAMMSGNPEAVRRAEDLLGKLRALLLKDGPEVVEYDVIVTEGSTIRGQLETNSIKAHTKFFGETTLKLADLRTLRNTLLEPTPKPGPAVKPNPGNRLGGPIFGAQPLMPPGFAPIGPGIPR